MSDARLTPKEVRLARKTLLMTQTEFAKHFGVSRSHIAHIENGSVQMGMILSKSIMHRMNQNPDEWAKWRLDVGQTA
jgi:predicted transcriptional regulator